MGDCRGRRSQGLYEAVERILELPLLEVVRASKSQAPQRSLEAPPTEIEDIRSGMEAKVKNKEGLENGYLLQRGEWNECHDAH